MKIPALLALALGLSACSYQYTLEQSELAARQLELRDSHVLHRQRDVLLASPDPVCLSLRPAFLDEAGREALQSSLAEALAGYYPEVHELSTLSSLAPLAQANLHHCGLLLELSLTQLNDEKSSPLELSATAPLLPGTDKVSLRVVARDVASSQILDTSIVSSRTEWLQLSSHQPKELIPGAWIYYLDRVAPLGSAPIR